jgi:hypothetical protein
MAGKYITWSFTTRVPVDRRNRLLAFTSFDDIVAQLGSARVEPMYWEPAMVPRLSGCHRASFKLKVDPDTYDAFFNSPAGYRGQYALAEACGAQANSAALASLLPKLLASAQPFAAHFPVLTSLRGEQAKIWIDESEVDDQLTDPHTSIVFSDWEFNEPNGQGLRAPVGTTLEIKGTWVNAAGIEVINQPKCARGRNISRTGDSK